MKLKIVTIILFVKDTARLKDFYMEFFRLEPVEETVPGWVLLQAGACQLGLHKIGKEYTVSDTGDFKAESNTKIVFEMEAGLVELRERLLKANITVKKIKTFPNYGFWVCDGQDPEGNVFQLRQTKG